MIGIFNAKIRALRSLAATELPFLKKHSPGDIKVLLPSATRFPAISFKRGKVYKDHSALLWEIVEIIKKDMAPLRQREGCTRFWSHSKVHLTNVGTSLGTKHSQTPSRTMLRHARKCKKSQLLNVFGVISGL